MQAVRRWRGVGSTLAGLPSAVRRGELRATARRLLTELGVDLATDTDRLSAPGGRGTLIVGNHVSWLDIVAALAVEPPGFLAKAEIAGWPVIGDLARRSGTAFVARDELRRLPQVVASLADTLRSGRSVLVFPEGTTWCGRCGGGTFRRAAFQAAIDAGAPIRPVTFEYRQDGEPSTVAAFVGEDTLLASLRRVVHTDDLTVRLIAHEPFEPDGTRRELAARAEATTRQVVHA
ncbi:1-acyl-sn-glycerol-3-phosphate acyltransferases [Amycolatopsis sacchari]|uniref:1-acyl-sn-glycerol-3-phosphate acyltransferases n=1 Tax=Amycolatopsis sacchari TaxID=115433 RepID=A0A1I4CLZ7_9PSEU|nr:lysophospholipid acyltransferase family protein [Amycolatopsis sacchari]SFK82302.1 1-acyl-sn-glycerol-3-phosphate acyltransferases [Amycolatopsis sacchari]